MTTFALIAGMIPVAIGAGEGADFRAPLGRAVIGGVITSTLLTLLVIPTVYEILDEMREWLFGLFRGKGAPRRTAQSRRTRRTRRLGRRSPRKRDQRHGGDDHRRGEQRARRDRLAGDRPAEQHRDHRVHEGVRGDARGASRRAGARGTR